MNNTNGRKSGDTALGLYRPKLTMYHPNGRGTGCAIELSLHPAHDNVDGSIMVRMANQVSVGERKGSNPTFSRFDWEGAICVKLDFNDLCKILQVFRGECESIEDGRGLYHRSPKASTRIVLRHLIEPIAGYSFELYRNPEGVGEETNAHIIFSTAEATGLHEAIAGSMAVIGFGIPMLVPHDTTAYKAATKEVRNVDAV